MTRERRGRTLTRWCFTSERLSGTVTFLFTDIEGSTALLKKVGREGYSELLARHQVLVRQAFAAHRGDEIDTQGDAFFVAFRSASDAVAAAVAIQRALVGEPWPDGATVRVRIGIHSGEASAAGERYVGFSVHRAARVGAVGHGGQVLLSDAARVLVEDDLSTGVSLRDLGTHRLKDVERPERIWQVVADGLSTAFPLLKTESRRRRAPQLRLVIAAGVVIAGGVIAGIVLVTHSGPTTATAAAPVAADSVGIFSSADGKPEGQAAVGTSPGAVAADPKAVWVTNADGGSVSHVDPATGSVQQTVPTGDGPAGVAIAGDAVWVTNSLDGNVARVDPQANTRVQTVTVGSQPGPIVSGPVGLWVANTGDRTLMRIDPRSGHVQKTIALATGADSLAEGDGALWVASGLNGTVERVDPRSGDSQPINVGRAPDAIAVGRGAVWVANNLDGTVSRIDPATNGVVISIPVGAGPVALAASSDGKNVWVSNEFDGTLMRIDTARNAVTKTVEIRDRPAGIALAADRMYVAVRTSGAAHRGGTLRVAIPFPITGPGPRSFFLDPAAAGYGNWYLPMGAGLTNDGLVAFRRAGGGEGLFLAPDLAVSLPAPTANGRAYTFQLRPGIHYSNGRLVRPVDFRRAIERVLALGGREQPGSYFDGIVGAAACVKTPKRCDLSRGITTAIGTVTFHLTGADPAFLYKLALPNAVAEPANTPLKAPLPLPATGPYMYRVFDKKRQLIEIVRNPQFRPWSAAARPDGFPDTIRIQFGYGSDGAVRAVERGKADLASIGLNNSLGVRTELRIRYRGLLHSNPRLNVGGAAVLNTRIPPFNDQRARRAFNYAVDRAHVVALAGADLATSSCQFLPPNLAGYHRYCPYMRAGNVDGPYTAPDPAKARRLVAESHTRGATVVIRDTNAQGTTPITRYLVSVLRGLGYRARSTTGDPKPGDQVAVSGWSIDYPDASDILVPMVSCESASNTFHFCDRRIDNEMARALSLEINQPQAAARLWAKVDRDLTDEAPWVPYLNIGSIDIVSRRVGNYVYTAIGQGALYDQLWVR